VSRTYRKTPIDVGHYLRHPKTFSEIKQLNWIKYDPDLKELGLPLPNRINKKVPTLFDDLIPSSYYQNYNKYEQN
jgi:hypothetical protein